MQFNCQGSMAGFVIQATGMTKFEDGPRMQNQFGVGNSLQKVCTIPKINTTIKVGIFCSVPRFSVEFQMFGR